MPLSLGIFISFGALSLGDGGRALRPPFRPRRALAVVPCRRNIPDRAFTLLELLIVIAIVAVLAALGYPSLQKSIQAGRSAKCVANLRTIGMAARQFANDNEGRILTWGGDTFTPFNPRWIQGLAPTLGNTGREAQWTPDILRKIYSPLACPSTPEKYRFGATTFGGMSYAANSFANPNWGWPEVRLLNFERPASTVYLVDGHATFAAWPGEDIVDQGWPPPAGWAAGTPVFFPHNGKCNALFLDGHVESFARLLPAKYIRP